MDVLSQHQFKGLEKDRTFQEDGSVTFALNAITDSHDGGVPEYQSEPGNQITSRIPNGYVLIGTIYGQDNEIYCFSTNNSVSEIGVFKQDYYTQLVSANLGFSTNAPITGEYRVRNGCERVIYWSDGNNPDMWFNVDKPNDFKTGLVFDPNKFKFNPSINVPLMDLVSVNDSGGNLSVGSYYFQLELLDKNQNLLYKTDITPQVPIYDDSISSGYYSIDGAVNYPQFDQLAGGVLPTTKSITLLFSNLTVGNYLRVNVAYQTTANQVIQAHQVGQIITIDNSTLQWTYTGFKADQGDSVLDYTSMIVDQQLYKSSYVMAQVQNRLLRANLKEDVRDYSTYQANSANIVVKWIAQESSTTDQTNIGNPKNPKTPWYKKNFMGDEVYCFAVQYLHNDGTWSPYFPLYGRAAVSGDKDLLTVVSNGTTPNSTQVRLSDVEHLGLGIGETVERWKVFNTASITTSQTSNHPYNYEGEFAYYEADFTYPDLRDCDGNSIWGGGITPETKVRFFKFPDRRLLQHLDGSTGEYIVPFGVKFSIPNYPNSSVIGHRFGYIKRTETNKTVTDTGWTHSASLIDDKVVVTGFYGSFGARNNVVYLSPQVQFNRVQTQASFIKQNRVYKIGTNTVPDIGSTTNFESINGHTIHSAIVYTNLINGQTVPENTNYKVNRQYFLDAGSDQTLNGVSILNDDRLTPCGMFELNTAIESYNSLNGGQASNTLLLPGGSFYNNSNVAYTTKKVTNQVYQNFLSAEYSYCNLNPILGTGTTSSYGGDSLISCNQTFRLASYTMYKLNEDTAENIFEIILNDKLWCETELNTDLRYEGTDLTYFRRGDSDLDAMKKFTDVIDGQGNSYQLQFKPIEDWIQEYYKLNTDLNLKSVEKPKFTLPVNYNFCQKCLGYYPNRIVFSPISFDEELSDQYRVNLVNDYVDIPGHRGNITGLSYLNNQLLVHCEDSTFIIQPNPQVVATDQSQAYLTTGDFLSIPPQELVQSEVGYAGCQNKQHQCKIPNGKAWLDQRRGQIFLWNGQLQEVSLNGLSQWFKENLPSELQTNLWIIRKLKYPYLNTTHNIGVGCILYYDPRYKRLLISKTDYQPINHYPTQSDGMYFNDTLGVWQEYQGDVAIRTVPFTDTSFFQRKSWTISYDLRYNRWLSWHSYLPYLAFSDDFSFYTMKTSDRAIWKHLDKTLYQYFYAVKYDFVVEWMNFHIQSDVLQSIYYQGYTYEWDKQRLTWVTKDKTFDRMLVYNDKQSTGIQTLVYQDENNPYANLNLTPSQASVVRQNDDFRISGIYDMSTDHPVITRDWTTLQTYTGYTDLMPYNIDFNKNPYQCGDIWGKYSIVRLFFKPNQDYKKLLILSELNKQVII